MRIRPYIISTGLSAGLQGVYALVMIGVLFFLVYPNLDLDVFSGSTPNVIVNLPLITGGIGFCLGPLINLGTGGLYAVLHRKEASLIPDQAVIGGAASAATASILGGLFEAFGGIVFLYLSLQSNLIPDPFAAGVDGLDPMVLALSFAGNGVVGFVGLCFQAGIAGFLGGVGGGLSGLMITK